MKFVFLSFIRSYATFAKISGFVIDEMVKISGFVIDDNVNLISGRGRF